MRGKIILVNGGIVCVLAVLTFFLLRTAVGGALADPSERRATLERALRSGSAQLTLDTLEAERWLDRRATEASVQDVFKKGTLQARQEAATAESNRLRDRAVAESRFAGLQPSLVLFVDPDGVVLGRNGSEHMRGEALVEIYPELGQAISAKATGSGFWVHTERQEQLVSSFAPVFGTEGDLVGALVLGMPLNDERLIRTSKLSSGVTLSLSVGGQSIARGDMGADDQDPGGAAFETPAVQEAVASAVSGPPVLAKGLVASKRAAGAGTFLFGALALPQSGSEPVVLVAAVPSSIVLHLNGLLWPVFAIALLGVFLVVAGGVVLGNYISRPIAEIEEGLLLVINGQQDLRFELDHDELGGLTSRVNALLNSLLHVPEGDGDSDQDAGS